MEPAIPDDPKVQTKKPRGLRKILLICVLVIVIIYIALPYPKYGTAFKSQIDSSNYYKGLIFTYYHDGDYLIESGGGGGPSFSLNFNYFPKLKRLSGAYSKNPKLIRTIESQGVIHPYLISGKNVYFKNKKIDNIDARTIIAHNSGYIETNDGIYYFAQNVFKKITEIENPDSFTPICKEYAHDTKNVYYFSLSYPILTTPELTVIKLPEGEEASDFKCVYIPNLEGLGRSNTTLYHHGEKIPGADPDTFKRLKSGGYFTDQNNVYAISKGSIFTVKGADPLTFNDYKTVGIGTTFSGYGYDKSHVYYKGELTDLTPYNLRKVTGSETIPSAEYVTDGFSVYFMGTKIINADASTFEYLGDYYAKDKNYVYKHGKILDGKHPETFELTR